MATALRDPVVDLLSTLGFLGASLPGPWSRIPPGSWASTAFCSTSGQISPEILTDTFHPPSITATSSISNTVRSQTRG
uniref:Uncharacterized protein n=2 Tax=Chloebia gouldiae TaxID=44316 RepID=A0A3L8QB13_CHLGU|nr:hypothetical protein DV515_00017605 [Chloebia gouldiae]